MTLKTQIHAVNFCWKRVLQLTYVQFKAYFKPRWHMLFTGAFAHPIYACVFRIVLRFLSTYVDSFMSKEKNFITSKMQLNAVNACGTECGNSALLLQFSCLRSNLKPCCHILFTHVENTCNLRTIYRYLYSSSPGQFKVHFFKPW